MLWFIGVLANVGIAAVTPPTYLVCELTNGSGHWTIDVALNESAGTAAIAMRKGRASSGPAAFTVNEVRVNDGPLTWVFDRNSLSFRRIYNYMPEGDTGDGGTCKIAPAPASRAF